MQCQPVDSFIIMVAQYIEFRSIIELFADMAIRVILRPVLFARVAAVKPA